MTDDLLKIAERFTAFLEKEPQTLLAINANEDFKAIADMFHCHNESRDKLALHFNWVSAKALPAQAVKSWVAKGLLHMKHSSTGRR